MRIRAVVAVISLAASAATATDVFNMGGIRDPNTGQWTGLASLETVQVGDPGNVGELSGAGAGGTGADRICGAVDYAYRIGKYEVTGGQYTEFLNAVARTDSYGLYSALMWSSIFGCKIQRAGSPGDYTYSVAPECANFPVNYIGFGDACRFVNWLQNGQPSGTQNAATTESGTYDLSATQQYYGADGSLPAYGSPARNALDAALLAVTRKAGCTWAIASEDEWYKAAYYNAATGTYYDYPTSSNSIPSSELLAPDGGNNANFGWTPDRSYTLTPVGRFALSASPCGTFDQGGNVSEWTEDIAYGYQRLVRGGNGGAGFLGLKANTYLGYYPTDEQAVGFRVALVPEPATLALLALGGLLLARRRRA